ncbi:MULTISPECIES: TolC family protein [Emticicia]|uniref:TolC family protein n=1 Tax=Emticicia TaxID=312278 RepID=UPI00209C8F31|nr:MULTISPECIES: TolC family protein [Emticicia]UTA69003.1 TolC family protein [Emticicia sp. 21SJ11W-3]
MKYLIYILSLYLLVVTYPSTAQGVTKLTLEEVVEMAKSQSIAARQASTTKETKFWEWRTFQSNYKPQLVLNGKLPAFTRSFTEVIQPDGTIQFQPVRYNNSSLNLSLSQSVMQTGGQIYAATQLQRFDDFARKNTLYNSTPFAVGYEQPILRFNPFKWDKKIEPLKYDESRRVYTESLEKIALKSTEYFFNLLLAQVNLQIAETNQSNTQTILKIAKEKYEIGKTTRNEILQLQLESLKAQKAIATAKRDLEIATLNLKAYIGMQTDSKLELIVPATISNISIPNQLALEQAFENRSDAISFRRLILEADRAVAKAIGDNGLNMTLTASLGFSNRGLTIPDLYNKPQSQESIQLQLDIPILDWGRSKSRTKTAEAQKKLTEYTVEQAKQTFRQEIYTQVTLFEMLKNQLTLTAQADSIASEKYQIAQDRYVLGNLSITDLSIAFQEKDQAKRDYINALQDYWKTHYELRYLTLYDFEKQRKIQPE